MLSIRCNRKRKRRNNATIVLNMIFIKKMNIYSAYISEHNLNHENQIILLMILNGQGLHYLAI